MKTTRECVRPSGLALALALAAATGGCAVQTRSTPSSETTATDEQPITGGQLINNGGDEVASMVPLSTVTIVCMFPQGELVHCTGEMVTTIQILTAAHCCPPQGGTLTTVYQYNAERNNANFAAIANYTAPYPMPVAPDGVTGAGPSGFDSTANYADIELITLPAPLPLPVTPAPPGFPGSFPTAVKRPLWEVGTGQINGQANSSIQMAYVPIAALGANDDTGEFGGLTTDSSIPPGNPGDSGGPVYELVGGALQVVGVTSYWNATATHFTSVLSTTNRLWIQNHLVAAPTQQEVQRDRRLIDPAADVSFDRSVPAAHGVTPFGELSRE